MKVSKQRILQIIFKKMNVKLNVETEDGAIVIGGLTPKWRIYKLDKGYNLVRVKWVGEFKETKSHKCLDFKKCIAILIANEAVEEYEDIDRSDSSREIKENKPKKKYNNYPPKKMRL